MSIVRSVVAGCGAYLPEQIVTNDDLSRRLDTSDAWIRQRTGICERRIAAKGETTVDIAAAAARSALAVAEISPADVDLVILATTTPDHTFPASAVEVQAKLGIRNGAAFDIQAVCSGFVYALSTADAHLRAGNFKCALVIGAETFSRLVDWNDRSHCVLFGDGGGAVVLNSQEQPGLKSDRGILFSKLRSDGSYWDHLYTDGGPSTTQQAGFVRMRGREVFKHAVTLLSGIVQETCDEGGFAMEDIDLFIPHQANRRIIESMACKLSLPESKVVTTIDHHANTSAASIPLALHEAHEAGRISRGDLLLIEAMGAGFTWGSVVLRW